jgi:hypothetical protein
LTSLTAWRQKTAVEKIEFYLKSHDYIENIKTSVNQSLKEMLKVIYLKEENG